jgi:hypothetical protein
MNRTLKIIACLLAALIVLVLAPAAWGAPRGVLQADAARSDAAALMAKAAGQAGMPGGMPRWRGAGTGAPLLVRDADGAPAEYMVPVTSGGKTISTVGIDAVDGGWHWYCNYGYASFPRVSAAAASSAVKGMLKTRGISAVSVPAPEARMGRDKTVYWYFKPQGSSVKEACVPAFGDGSPASVVQGKPGDSQPSGGASAVPSPVAANEQSTTDPGARVSGGSGSSGGYPSSYNIADVPYHQQLTDWWCGPASLEMVFDYCGPDVSQSEIAGVANQAEAYGVYADDLMRAAHFSSKSTSVQDPALHGYTARSTGYAATSNFWENGSALYDRRYTDLKSMVSQNIPVLALTWYSSASHSGHFRVVKGYNDGMNALIVNDPWYTGSPAGPDVVFNQNEFVDNLWTYSDRWAMTSSPWTVDVSKPGNVSAGQNFTVNASVNYPGPDPMDGQYSASGTVATIDAEGFQVTSGSTTQSVYGLSSSGSTGNTSWNVRALGAGKTDGISVSSQGLVSGSTRRQGSYSDYIGGTGSTAPPPGPTTRAWGHDSIGVSQASTSWFLAEGCTKGGFETWVLVQNPDADLPAHVRLTYMTTQGPVAGPSVTIPASSRMTFNVADVVPDEWSVSTQVTSDVGVVAERAMYGNNRRLGTDSIGVPQPATNWYLAEGCTNGGFETWVLVQNPNPSPARVTLKYMRSNGPKAGPTVTIAANSRVTFNAADVVPNEWSVSTQVMSDKPVVAERSMYGNHRQWGHDSVGATDAQSTWYLAEGCTNGGFETWVLVQNPGSTAADVTLTYMTESGQVPGPTIAVPPNSRKTVSVADYVPNTWSVSTKVTSPVPIIAERAVYGNSRTWGHDSIGVPAPATTWYLAEGCTNTGFETWVLVQNPNNSVATISITYMTPAGPVDGPVETLQPNSRKTYQVAATVPWEWQVSTKVVSSRPVIAERAMYGDSK